MLTTVLARRGLGYQQYRIPALGRTASGRLLAIYDGRPDVDDLPAPIDLVYRSSDDDGHTWSAQRVLRTGTGWSGYGDASIVGDDGRGRVVVLHQATLTRGFFEGGAPDDPQAPHIDAAVSCDDGESWTFRRLTPQLRAPGTDAAFAASGRGCVVRGGPHPGRMLQPLVERVGTTIRARLAWSDDGGERWSLGLPLPGANESAVTELPDGELLLSCRATPHRLTGRSRDPATWSLVPDAALADPSDNGDVLAAHAFTYCSHNADPDLRRNLVVERSTDGGRTWPERATVESASAAYSVLIELGDGCIGVLFERDGYGEIAFARIAPEDFRPAAAPSSEGLRVDLALRMIRPAPLPPTPDAPRLDLRDSAGWDPAAWREIGAAQAGADSAALHPREAYAVLRPPRAALDPTDTLFYAARVAAGASLTDLRWRFLANGEQRAAGGESELRPEQPLLLRLEAPGDPTAVSVVLIVTAESDDRRVSAEARLTHDGATGLRRE